MVRIDPELIGQREDRHPSLEKKTKELTQNYHNLAIFVDQLIYAVEGEDNFRWKCCCICVTVKLVSAVFKKV